MSTQEAYKIFFGETNQQVDEEFIKANYTSKDITKKFRELVKKYHPDKFVNDPSFAEEKMKDVNQAKEVLTNIINKKTITTSKTTTKNNKKKQEHTKIHSHRDLGDMLNNLKILDECNAYRALYKVTNDYYSELKKAKSFSDIFKRYDKYNKFLIDIKLKRQENAKLIEKYINYYNSKGCDDLVIEHFLHNFAKNSYDKLDDFIYGLEIKNELSSLKNDLKIFNQRKSYILNIKNMYISAITNLQKLDYFLVSNKLYKDGKETFIIMNKDNMNETVETCREYKSEYSRLINNLSYMKKESKRILNELNEMEQDKITLDYAIWLDEISKKIISNVDYLPLIFDESRLNSSLKKSSQKQSYGYKKYYRKITLKWKSLLPMMEKDTEEYIYSIKKITTLLSKYDKDLKEQDNKTTIKENEDKEETIVNKYFYNKSKSQIYKEKAVDLLMEIFLNYYYGYKQTNIPNDIIDIYLSNDIEYIYQEFNKNYIELRDNYILEKSKEFPINNEEYIRNTKVKLIRNIQQIVIDLYNRNYEFNNSEKEKIQIGIENLDIMELFKLYNGLEKDFYKLFREVRI